MPIFYLLLFSKAEEKKRKMKRLRKKIKRNKKRQKRKIKKQKIKGVRGYTLTQPLTNPPSHQIYQTQHFNFFNNFFNR